MTQALTPSQESRDATPFDLGAAATEFFDKFPAFAARLTFVDVCTGAVLSATPEKLQQDLALIGASETGRKELKPLFGKALRDKTAYAWDDRYGNHIIFMYTGSDRPSSFGGAIPQARELQFIFDHEAGHVLVPEGSSNNPLLAENAADAFAVLNDLQRHGGDARFAETAMLFRAAFALFHEEGLLNFSSPVIEKIIEQRADILKEPLSPDQTVALAGRLAAAHTMEIRAALQLRVSVEKLKEHPKFETLRDIALETPLPDTFKWTSTVLKAVLERRITLPGLLGTEFTAAADLSAQIAAREREFAARLPAAAAPKSPATGPAASGGAS